MNLGSLLLRPALATLALAPVSLALISCSSPGVQQLSRPLTESSFVRALTDPSHLAKSTATVLREEDLMKTYKRDSIAAYRALADRYRGAPTEARRLALAELASSAVADFDVYV